jgi:Ca2+-binding RTX toxin-like protein
VITASARASQADANPADNDATLRIEPAAAPSPSLPSSAAKAVQRTVRTGTARRDTLRGTNGPDSLFGLGGRDVLYGFGGPDTLVGGTGADRLFGGAGNDTILARDRARDTIACGSGRDVVQADPTDRVARDCERIIRARLPK